MQELILLGKHNATTSESGYTIKTNIDTDLAQQRRSKCPKAKGSWDHHLAPINAQTPIVFDNSYYKNLVQKKRTPPFRSAVVQCRQN